jgi:predicted unusual protein kinase regulating ubiquinone biosynthesis (AarF/ABC1/UbiB family)
MVDVLTLTINLFPFVHKSQKGDLHPGNVLVSPDCKFILLDVGIVTQHSPSDHRLISDVLAAFIRCDGRRAGQLMSTFFLIIRQYCFVDKRNDFLLILLKIVKKKFAFLHGSSKFKIVTRDLLPTGIIRWTKKASFV